jgi:hypothetical protein
MRSTKLFRGQAILAALFGAAALASGAFAQDSIGEPKGDAGKPNPLNNVYFGEQHLHTVNSPDAFAFGTRNGPDEAYKFCKGEAIKKQTTGEMIQKKTPYDWCAVTDHAEYMGIMPLLLKKDNPLADTEIGKDIASGDPAKGEAAFQQIISSAANNVPIPYMVDPKLMVSIWDEQKKITNKHNDPGKFTTLIAFEWTSIPNYQNLHHNVFFRDDKGPDTQFSSFDSVKREDLWTYQEVQRAMGHENFSIPHNSNVSIPGSGRSAASPTPWQPRSGRPRATPRPFRRCRRLTSSPASRPTTSICSARAASPARSTAASCARV